TMLRSDPGVVEPCGNGMDLPHLTVVILEEVAQGTVEDPGPSAGKGCRVLPRTRTPAAGLDTDETHRAVAQKAPEDADGVRPSPHARNHIVRQASRLFQDLPPRLPSDDRLEVADHEGERVGSHHA